ncbi:Phosphatidate cytidylyltransferase [Astathelohania contejeani]|uniref:Phosphatidate cytidylyltransferase n=1 Tax=Astathelohania contejeani TaxID=164912 RepID=A0ABQ7HYF8_9MICR|nr:Phosphatidate cytidylyltransferase [Thelohania contejeani]
MKKLNQESQKSKHHGSLISGCSNLTKRFIMSLIMALLLSVLIYIGEVSLEILIIVIMIASFREILSIMNKSNDRKKWISNYIIWYMMILVSYYMIGGLFLKSMKINKKEIITNNFLHRFTYYLSKRHKFFCFSGYISILVLFIVSLRPGHLKSQFAFFGLIHLIVLTLASSGYAVISNIKEGVFWFVFPVLLVASNDVFAYVIGKKFGRTPLIKLSPNKTVEGFIGGFIFTVLMGYLLGYIRLNYNIFQDCYSSALTQPIKLKLFFYSVSIPSIYFHVIPFVLFASFIAPFGGFFASGFKRAYKAKDFGESIPGHGGIADRIDCQIINGIFTHVYLMTYLISKERRIEKTYNHIVKNFNDEQIQILMKMLTNRNNL